ncbi:hypothetical protein J4T77_04710 [Wolbachia endosymbiont of Drosophila innubila]|uniref:hypothetical protein n=1 Tax=Wolbachia TaxID=953 RepID=UPI00168138F9|nr:MULTISPECIES: hypothetical protein [Wolbachia]MBA8753337.1 hypothetical protein [Wolbachia pipientis]UID81031.1 hypothetical protein J4T77_04710 [Wolbachia endosymbiont of Drosophila innubila]
MSSQCPDYLDPVFFTNSQKVLHSITQNPYSPNPMHYLQLSFLDPSSQGTRMTRERGYWDDSYPDNRHPTTC